MRFISRWAAQKHINAMGKAWGWNSHLPRVCSTLLLSKQCPEGTNTAMHVPITRGYFRSMNFVPAMLEKS